MIYENLNKPNIVNYEKESDTWFNNYDTIQSD